MTHTHHRRGPRDSLEKDYVILSMIDLEAKAQHSYKGPLRDRVRRFLEICGRRKPVALLARTSGRRLRYAQGWAPEMDGGIHRVSKLEDIVGCNELADEGIGHAVYTGIEVVKEVLRELKEADLGISIVVSGIFEEVFDACRKVGIEPHTVNMSLGTWGRTELLPEQPVLELCTMCGHAMVSPRLVDAMVSRVRKGETTAREAAVELGKQCTCNIYNTVRAAEIISCLSK
ncbi:MAG: hypothetical protein ACETVY_06960 [Candidatus Bathyarchaeia archaeon]